MPRALAEELESLLSNRFVSKVLECSSLQDYVGASLMSDDLSTLRSRVPETNLNYGVLLRWTLGLYEMEAFYVDMQAEERNEIMKSWAQGTRELIKECGPPFVEVLELNDKEPFVDGTCESDTIALSTIISFKCRCRRGGPGTDLEEMTTDELRRVQFLMATDIGNKYPDLRLFGAARERCFMGQPVRLNPGSSASDQVNVLRVAASAPLVTEINRHGLDVALAKDRILVEKLALLLGNWKMFEST